jgi:hypothetical protein
MNIERLMILRKAVEPAIAFFFALGIGYTSFHTPTDQQAEHAIAIAKAAGLPDGKTGMFRRIQRHDFVLWGRTVIKTSNKVRVSRHGHCYTARGILPVINVPGFGVEKCYPKNG